MIVSLLVAMDEARGIGYQNRLPWRLSADLKKFKELTMGHHIIMGRKTYESIGRPLPGRTSIVVSRNPEWEADGVLVANSLEAALELARSRGEEEAFIIGGGVVFMQALELADRIYLTRVKAQTPVDVFFPDFEPTLWREVLVEEHPQDEKNDHDFTFSILERK
jgi:dihydrofolate reductase